MNRSEFIAWEKGTDDTIDLKRIYVDMAGDPIAGVLLSQIVYWHLPDRDGRSRLRVYKDGYPWVAKTHWDWWNECRINRRQLQRAIDALVDRNLIACAVRRFSAVPTVHVRIKWERFIPALEVELAIHEAIRDKEDTAVDARLHATVQTDCTLRCKPLHVQVQSLTETTSRDYKTETTADLNTAAPAKTAVAADVYYRRKNDRHYEVIDETGFARRTTQEEALKYPPLPHRTKDRTLLRAMQTPL